MRGAVGPSCLTLTELPLGKRKLLDRDGVPAPALAGGCTTCECAQPLSTGHLHMAKAARWPLGLLYPSF